MSFLSRLLSDEEVRPTTRRLLALLLLASAGAIALFGRFEGTFFYVFTTTYTITPGFLAGILGIGLIAPLYLRKILHFRFSVYGILSAFLLLFIFSSLIQIIIGNGWFTSAKTMLVIAAILLAWLGMRGVANMAWFLLFIAVIINVQNLSDAMGLWGWLFVALSFFGLILHTKLGPAELARGLRAEFIEGEVLSDRISKQEQNRADAEHGISRSHADSAQ